MDPDSEVPAGKIPDELRIAIVDDHALVRRGLSDLMIANFNAQIVFNSAALEGILDLDPSPDLVILDLDLGGVTASAADARSILDRGIPILVVSALGSPEAIRSMVQIGVAGFVSKAESPETLIEAVKCVFTEGAWTSSEVAAAIAGDPGRPPLSAREERVLVLYASGMKIESVARRVGIGSETVKTYLKRIRRKYADAGREAFTRTDLYREAVRDGLIDRPDR